MASNHMDLLREFNTLNQRKKSGGALAPAEEERLKQLATHFRALQGGGEATGASAPALRSPSTAAPAAPPAPSKSKLAPASNIGEFDPFAGKTAKASAQALADAKAKADAAFRAQHKRDRTNQPTEVAKQLNEVGKRSTFTTSDDRLTLEGYYSDYEDLGYEYADNLRGVPPISKLEVVRPDDVLPPATTQPLPSVNPSAVSSAASLVNAPVTASSNAAMAAAAGSASAAPMSAMQQQMALQAAVVSQNTAPPVREMSPVAAPRLPPGAVPIAQPPVRTAPATSVPTNVPTNAPTNAPPVQANAVSNTPPPSSTSSALATPMVAAQGPAGATAVGPQFPVFAAPTGLVFLDDFPLLYARGVLANIDAQQAAAAGADDIDVWIPGKRKVTIHMLNSEVKRGDLLPVRRGAMGFHLEKAPGNIEEIPWDTIKALFIHTQAEFPTPQASGRTLTVTFRDQRSLQGLSLDYSPNTPLFTLVPPGGRGQFERVIVNTAAVARVQ